jgi:hypothetical protein
MRTSGYNPNKEQPRLWPFRKRTIRVEFVDLEGRTLIPPAQVPANNLPQSFCARTVMHLEGLDYEVVEAKPSTGFVEKGCLRLTLRAVERLNAEDILFSLPSLSDALPALQPAPPLDGPVLVLHEDDWGQVELRRSAERVEIEREMAEIRRVLAEQRTASGGFREVHLRKLRPPALDLPLDGLPDGRPYDRVEIDSLQGGQVRDGFARQSDSLLVYGLADVRVRALCLEVLDPLAASIVEQGVRLQTLARDHDLVLVDWCVALLAEPSSPQFMNYFGPEHRGYRSVRRRG